jgi:hypothetical protein
MINIQVVIDGFLIIRLGNFKSLDSIAHGQLVFHFIAEALTQTPSITMRSKLDLWGR